MANFINIHRHKKLAFLLTHDSLGGLELNILKYAKYLLSINVKVVLILAENSAPLSWANRENIPCQIIPRPKKYFSIKESLLVQKIFVEEKISEVLLSTSQDLDLYCWAYLYNTNPSRPFLTFYQQMQIGVIKKNIYHRWRFSFVDHWICPLENLKIEVLKKTTIKNEIISINPLAMNTKDFCNSIANYKKSELKKLFSLDPETIVFGIIGRIDPGKGQHHVVEAFYELIKNQNNYDTNKIITHLFIVGSPTLNDKQAQSYFNQLKFLINNYNLQTSVTMVSHSDNPEKFYKLFDILIVASANETFGMVTIEGLLAKLPIIGANSGGTKEILKDGALGLLYNVSSSNDLANKMNYMVTHIQDFKEKIDSIFVETNYSFEQLYKCQNNFKKFQI